MVGDLGGRRCLGSSGCTARTGGWVEQAEPGRGSTVVEVSTAEWTMTHIRKAAQAIAHEGFGRHGQPVGLSIAEVIFGCIGLALILAIYLRRRRR